MLSSVGLILYCTSNSNTEYASNNDDDFSDINLERVHFNFSLGPILLIYGQSFVCLRSVLYSRIGLRGERKGGPLLGGTLVLEFSHYITNNLL